MPVSPSQKHRGGGIMKILDVIVTILLIVGGINLGLLGFFNVNVIAAIFGEATALTRVIYALIGLGGLYEIGGLTFGFKAVQHRWCETPATVKH